ncbi:unnamed protein product [Chilo suppressalis]|uniref:Peptidase S1 domain-containing protein n=1 Tax=Chilo suppressalis TaxID=168631 RepID=A0ABN8AVY5_CHISP|nr:hypothetical protein evm_008068 [Chilo suppressalis]CAH0400323.1 unnamed protein product [Chilo suppressalis]
MESKIVGGSNADIRNFPHAVFLEVSCGISTWICGSSVLNQRILLSAAHCFEECPTTLYSDNSIIYAFGGNEDYTKQQSIVRNVANILLHENYDVMTVENDIALAKIDRQFPLNDFIKRVIISSRFPSDREAKVAGWGIIEEVSHRSIPKLRYVTQRLTSRYTCSLVGGGITKGMFCAGGTNPKVPHPSSGDSGSALITSQFIDIGIVSFRDRNMHALVVYTNVTYYKDWIQSNAKRLVCD